MKNFIALVIAFIILTAVGFGVFQYQSHQVQRFAGITDASCSVNTVSAVSVGDDVSSTILSAKGNRAYAKIQLVETAGGVATSTVFLSLDEGAAATLNNGLKLATSTPFIEVGRNADNPYTGAITGITNGTASTTVLVTECSY